MERPVGIYASSASRRGVARRRGRGRGWRMRVAPWTLALTLVLIAVLAERLAA